jgi:hypothetical protein
MAKAHDVSDSDKKKLFESLNVERSEPEQIEVPKESDASRDSQIKDSNIKRLQQGKQNMEKWMTAAKAMQKVLAIKLKDRVIRVDPAINPSLREAIRNTFGINSDTVTYEMFQQALELRSAAAREGRKSYASGNVTDN